MENKMSVRQLLYGQEYPSENGDIIKKIFYCKAAVDWCVAYLHGLSQITDCPRYTGKIIASCTWLRVFPIENNAILGAEKSS